MVRSPLSPPDMKVVKLYGLVSQPPLPCNVKFVEPWSDSGPGVKDCSQVAFFGVQLTYMSAGTVKFWEVQVELIQRMKLRRSEDEHGDGLALALALGTQLD
jgi:hypothetical protein